MTTVRNGEKCRAVFYCFIAFGPLCPQVFTEIFGADCDAGFAHHFGAPLLSVMSSSHLPWSYDRVGGPDNPSYTPTIVTRAAGAMDFGERVANALHYAYFKLAWTYHSEWPADELLRENFGPDTPYVGDIVRNTSMVFVNGHHALDGPGPLVPNMVEIGGIHLKRPEPIPKVRGSCRHRSNQVVSRRARA